MEVQKRKLVILGTGPAGYQSSNSGVDGTRATTGDEAPDADGSDDPGTATVAGSLFRILSRERDLSRDRSIDTGSNGAGTGAGTIGATVGPIQSHWDGGKLEQQVATMLAQSFHRRAGREDQEDQTMACPTKTV